MRPIFVLGLTLAIGCDCNRESAEPAPASVVAPAELREVSPTEIAQLVRDQPGRAVLVNVWSTWCEPCVEEFPELVEIGRSYEARGLSTLFI